MTGFLIKSVAIIGAGAAGAATAAAFDAEEYYDTIRVFERRESAGGTWIYDPDPNPIIMPRPGKLPPDTDPPLEIPNSLPAITRPSAQERYEKTPIHENLTTNVPAIAMSLATIPFPYGPFVPHHIPKQYIENHFSSYQTDKYLVLNTTVEDVSRSSRGRHKWVLTLRRYDPVDHVDRWWKEEFDAVVLANGHYSIPYVPPVKGLEDYSRTYPGRVMHSKSYRSSKYFREKRVLVIGNSASGHDVTIGAVETAKFPVYQSRRSPSHWDGENPPPGIEWKPIVKEYLSDTGEIFFDDGSVLRDIDVVVYCTGYKASFPFWNSKTNGAAIFDYAQDRLVGNYLHVFLTDFPTVGVVGMPRTLTFRSFDYQAIALARVFSGRNARPLPSHETQRQWEAARCKLVESQHRRFHDIPWDNNESLDYLRELYGIAGLPCIEGQGLVPPVLDKETRWAIEHVRKYMNPELAVHESDWEVIEREYCRDSLHFL